MYLDPETRAALEAATLWLPPNDTTGEYEPMGGTNASEIVNTAIGPAHAFAVVDWDTKVLCGVYSAPARAADAIVEADGRHNRTLGVVRVVLDAPLVGVGNQADTWRWAAPLVEAEKQGEA